ncbi:DMT family transporter [Frigidibacter sp. ROC022]|uniref:DMT family transporter n=1 Tax=Frigidibacter sp. ROC022 TaxID=2971796 RepID=UPI00215B23E9|nr:DMT family transporter [Frigidibacter sp. ROC022]MCR8725282.1 DMT family transporter [Frigidibacter sp. ROC022]
MSSLSPPSLPPAQQPTGAAQRVPLGIALMLGFCMTIPFSDACAKLIGDRLPLGEMVLIRFVGQFVLLAPLALALGGSLAMPRRVLAIVVLRAVLQMTAMGLMFLSLRWLPLADAVAIAFVMPFMMLAFGWFFAGEEVGRHRLAACTVGFGGTLLVVQPNFVAVGAPALLPMAAALLFALFMFATRSIARHFDPVAMQAMTGGVALLWMLPVLALGQGLGWNELRLVMPERSDVWVLILMTLAGTLAHLLMTWSLRFAPASTLAPMQYLEIPCAALVGWLIFHDFPNNLALLGISITIAAGLYIVHRERRRARA